MLTRLNALYEAIGADEQRKFEAGIERRASSNSSFLSLYLKLSKVLTGSDEATATTALRAIFKGDKKNHSNEVSLARRVSAIIFKDEHVFHSVEGILIVADGVTYEGALITEDQFCSIILGSLSHINDSLLRSVARENFTSFYLKDATVNGKVKMAVVEVKKDAVTAWSWKTAAPVDLDRD